MEVRNENTYLSLDYRVTTEPVSDLIGLGGAGTSAAEVGCFLRRIPIWPRGHNIWHCIQKQDVFSIWNGNRRPGLEHTRRKTWSLAWTASSVQDGYVDIGAMTVFKGQLYQFLYPRGDSGYSERVMRTRDGQNWETVIIADNTETYFHSPTVFTTFNGALYVGGLTCNIDDECYGFLMRSGGMRETQEDF